jgi:hypothetical protein
MSQPDYSSEETLLIEGPGQGIIVTEELDHRLIPNEAWVDARNVRFFAEARKARKMDSYALFDTTTGNAAIRQLLKYSALDGSEILLRITNSEVFKGAAPAVSIGAGLTGTVDDIVTWDQFADLLIWTDKKDVPKKWDGVAANFSNLGGSPPKAKIVRIFKSHVCFFNVNDGTNRPYRMTYSAIGTPEIYTGATSGVLDFVEAPGLTGIIITAAEVLGDYIYVFRDRGIHRVSFVDLPGNFDQEVVPAEDGTMSARMVVRVGPYLYYAGYNNIYRLANVPEPIGPPIYRKMIATADFKRKHLFHAYHRKDFYEIHFMFVSTDTNQPGFGFVYNYKENTWTTKDYDPNTSFVRVHLGVGDDTWNGGPATIWDDTGSGGSDALISWDDPLIALGADYELISQKDGKIQAYAGINTASMGAFAAYLESKHFNLGSLLNSRILRIPVIASGSGNLQVSIRAWRDERQTLPAYTDLSLYALDPDSSSRPWVDCREYGRFAQVKFANAELTDDFELVLYGLKYLPGGGIR